MLCRLELFLISYHSLCQGHLVSTTIPTNAPETIASELRILNLYFRSYRRHTGVVVLVVLHCQLQIVSGR